MNYASLEEILLTHPDVVEVCTIAVPKPSKEKEAKIFVVLRENKKVTAEELMAYLKSRVNGQSEKIDIAIIDELPKSPTGIVLRRKLVSLC
ncbi:MAG: AMP-binding enzyme [Candidatus Hydrogenedens sp.]